MRAVAGEKTGISVIFLVELHMRIINNKTHARENTYNCIFDLNNLAKAQTQ